MSNPTTASFPLSPMQLGMLYEHMLDERGGLDILQIVVELPEPVDTDILRASWQVVVDRHMVLHSAIDRDDGGRFVWRVESSAPVPFTLVEWTDLRSDQLDERFERLLARDRMKGFSLDTAPLVRVQLIRLGEDRHRMVWTVPHIALDAGAFVSVLREVWVAYEALEEEREADLPPVRPYDEYLEWRAEHQDEVAEGFWSELLEGFRVPVDVSSGGVSGGRTLEVEKVLPEGLTERLSKLAEAKDVRLSTVVLAAWGIVLGRVGRQSDVVFGQTRSGRPGTVEGAEEMVGLFINTVPTRTLVDSDRSLETLLDEVRRQQVEVRPHEYVPLSDIQSWSELPKNTALFQTILVFDRSSLRNRLRSLGGAWSSRDAYLRERLSSELVVHVYADDPLRLVAVADAESFGRERVEALLDGLDAILRAIADRPEGTIGDFSLVSDERRHQLLVEWNDTERSLPDERRIHRQFQEMAATRCDAVALRAGRRALTYGELGARSDRVAHDLRKMDVGPGTLVGLVAERSLETVVGVLGILKAGGAYLPLDPELPRARIGFMLEDSRVDVLVTTRRRVPELPEHRCGTVYLDFDACGAEGECDPVQEKATPKDLAYVMYTSGSTGRPKGVEVEHRNVTAFFSAMDEELGTDPGVWLSVTTLAFDISVLELLWALTRGFEVVLYDEGWEAAAADPTGQLSTMDRSPPDFSLFYFSAVQGSRGSQQYELLLEGARFGDERGFKAIWTPERHFHAFGGLYPNPSVTGAALAAITERIEIRSGSIVLPLHHPVRVVEEWSVVDNISGGRVGVSFASGWQADDFCIRPDHYHDRKAHLYETIDTVRALWRGEARTFPGPKGDVKVRTLPRPLQEELPVWVTTAGSVESFESAGRIGANVLTHLLGQSVEDLREKIRVYREARAEAGHPGDGCVSLMLHTFIGENDDEVRELVREPMKSYLRTAVGLIKNFQQAWEIYEERESHENDERTFESLSEDDMESLLDFAFERYYENSALFGSIGRCMGQVDRLRRIGVDEIACLIDFGVEEETTLQHLEFLSELRARAQEMEIESVAVSFADLVRRYDVTHVQCTPSRMLMFLADHDSREAFRGIGTVIVGGERLPGPMAAQLRQLIEGRVLNMYGPTETTIWSSAHEVGPDDAKGVVAIGRPLANERLYVVDPALQPVPPGVPGELLIGGAGVVRGYRGRPELTAEKFLPDPFVDDSQARVYRTGDLVQYRTDGVIDFLGRLDDQVKIRGHRVELGEVDAALMARDDVDAAASVVHEPNPGDQRLVSYYVSERGGRDFEEELLETLRRSLPTVMVPSVLVRMDGLPTTPNGKIDRSALPEPTGTDRGLREPDEMPRTDLERRIAAIWSQELGVDSLRVDENFFDAGGHSLLAVQVQARLQSDLRRKISLAELFRFPTVRSLAEHLSNGPDGPSAAEEGVDRAAMRRRSRRGRSMAGDASP